MSETILKIGLLVAIVYHLALMFAYMSGRKKPDATTSAFMAGTIALFLALLALWATP